MKRDEVHCLDLGAMIDVFDELPFWSAPFGLKLLESVNYKPAIIALDIGFGAGFPLIELAMRLGESSTVYGIDPWKEAIERVRKKIELFKIPNINIFEGVAENIPLENSSVDLITSNNGLNNVQDMERVVSECSRIMKSGGQLVLTMNLDTTMFEFYTELEKVLKELQMFVEITNMHQHIYEKRRPLVEIISIIQGHEFIITDVEQDQFNYKFTNGTSMFQHYFIRMAFMDAWSELIPHHQWEKIFSTIENRLNEKAIGLGGIKLSIPFVCINAIRK